MKHLELGKLHRTTKIWVYEAATESSAGSSARRRIVRYTIIAASCKV